ncbi:hypothetical protein BGS_0387 [Beggiatoa sp. SS]|nr:hypothetical protein BGS_0387 [Beggiatoa sp. SS]
MKLFFHLKILLNLLNQILKYLCLTMRAPPGAIQTPSGVAPTWLIATLVDNIHWLARVHLFESIIRLIIDRF